VIVVSAGASRRRSAAEDGAGAVEHVGVLVLVAALVAGLFVVALPDRVGEWARFAVCRLFTVGGDCEQPVVVAPRPGPDDAAYLPDACLLSEHGQHVSSQVKIAFFTFGQDYGFIEQEFADGSVRVTVVDGATIGLLKETGTNIIDLGKLGTDEAAGTEVKLDATLSFGYGDTWVFDSRQQADEMRAQLDEYLIQQVMRRNASMSGGGALGTELAIWIMGRAEPPKDPSITFSRVGISGSATGSAGLQSPLGTDADGGPTYLDPNVGFQLALDASYDVLIANDRDAGTTSYTYTLSGHGRASVDVVVGQGSLDGTTTGSVKVTRDTATGDVVALELVTTREGGFDAGLTATSPVDVAVSPSAGGTRGESTATVTTVRLDVTTAEERELVDGWLSGTNEQIVVPGRLTYSSMVPTERASGDPFQNLLFERARVSQIQYDNVTDVRRFGLDLNAGYKFGFEVKLTDTSSHARDPHYLSAPRHDGTRSLLVDETCA
jgi:hypothetical protein